MFAGAVSTCCFLLVARWANGDWVSTFLSLSGRSTSGPPSIASLGYLIISARAPFEQLELISEHRYVLFRASYLPHLSFQELMRTPECWNLVLASPSTSREIKGLPS